MIQTIYRTLTGISLGAGLLIGSVEVGLALRWWVFR